jgi:hypothetical protein
MDCLSATGDLLLRLLGGEIESQELTAEAFRDVEQEQQDRHGH